MNSKSKSIGDNSTQPDTSLQDRGRGWNFAGGRMPKDAAIVIEWIEHADKWRVIAGGMDESGLTNTVLLLSTRPQWMRSTHSSRCAY